MTDVRTLTSPTWMAVRALSEVRTFKSLQIIFLTYMAENSNLFP